MANDKVKELVEWVAQKYHSAKVILGEVYLHPVDWAMLDEEQKEWYRKQARLLLSHPDLALRDRTKPVKYDLEANTNYIAVIPLAEALKGESPKTLDDLLGIDPTKDIGGSPKGYSV